jgi:hypothetical protein
VNSIIWKTIVSAGAMLGAACGGKPTPPPAAPEPAPIEAAPAPTPVEPAPEPPAVAESRPAPPEPEPPPPPAMVTVTIESEPSAADVYIDGELVGKTPLRLERSPNVEMNIRVTRDGYQEKTATLTTAATADAPTILQITMVKAKKTKRPRGSSQYGTLGHGSGSSSGRSQGRGFILS